MKQKDEVIEVFDLFAKRYSDQYFDRHMYRDTLEYFSSMIAKDTRVLEIACGPGNVTNTLLEINSQFSILGLDISPEMISLAQKNISSAEFKVHDILNLSQLDEKFPAILVGFCFPYLNKEEVLESLKQIALASTDLATLYISTIAGDYNNSYVKGSSTGEGSPLTLYYYDIDFFTKELKPYGFGLQQHYLKSRKNADGSVEQDLILIAKRNISN
ncbi:class I SAM-dependent methyltransferase [Saprospiraceae bacterium]|nr:class I SAM-dependent methyltransferase [Saprospiraceae bacterium]